MTSSSTHNPAHALFHAAHFSTLTESDSIWRVDMCSLPTKKPYWEFLLKPLANMFNIWLLFHLTHINSDALQYNQW